MQDMVAVFEEGKLMLGRRWLGVHARLAQQGTSRALAIAGRGLVKGAGSSLTWLSRATEQLWSRFLVRIGWKRATVTGNTAVITRPFLPQEYVTDASSKDLSALYRHLFRLEPVADPRFLVGREQELMAIAEARSFWEGGRPTSLIIVGERGSGKSSLINCALKRSLDGLEVIRQQFSDRLVAETQMRDFLSRVAGAGDSALLESFLAERRRVIILEEIERAFLRQIGRYDAIKSLERLIGATSASTLWILVINHIAFRFLDRSVGLGACFSHRINAGNVSCDDLREAVLFRHNLSGLRISYAAPQSRAGFTDWLFNRTNGEADPETVFFESLAKESAGVFRGAFNLWLSHIESIQDGMVYMKPLAPADLSRVIDDLSLPDVFALTAILQHGSLTAEELSIVFQKSIAASQAQINDLLAREIIESDPGRAGFRVKPEAMRVVKEMLYRRNLL